MNFSRCCGSTLSGTCAVIHSATLSIDGRADLGARGPAVPTCMEEVEYLRFIGHISANISAKPVEFNLYRPYIGYHESDIGHRHVGGPRRRACIEASTASRPLE